MMMCPVSMMEGDGIIDVDFILLIFGIWLGLFVSFFALWTLGNKWGWW
jgi:hypothetical protein